MRSFLDAFESLFLDLYGEDLRDEGFSLERYFDEVQLPQSSQYAYGERVAMREEERADDPSLRRAYEVLTDYIELDRAWQTPPPRR